MRKYLLFLLFCLINATVFGQKVTRVELVQSQSFIGLKRNGENTNKVIKPIFRQENAILTCDSAYFYLEKNSFEAFGNVHINQADTINIYSDFLNYDGNTKMAVLTNNVKLTDNDAVLTTNNLEYNMGSKIGRYVNGGKIVNDKNVLTSENGYYFTQSKDAYFRYNVKVKSPEVLIISDTLKYNTISKIAYFFGPTNIYGKTDTLYTENGQYNTTNDQAKFGKNNLYTQNSKSLKGDSLFYDGKVGYGRAVKNIIFIDTAQKVELRGNLGIYTKRDESIMVTKNAYVIFITEKDSVSKDSVWLTADTLRSKVLSKMDLYSLQQKAIIALSDTSKILKGSSNLKLSKVDSLNSDSLKATQKLIKKEPIKKIAEVNPKISRLEPLKKEIVTRAPIIPVIWSAIKAKPAPKIGLILIDSLNKKQIEVVRKIAPPEASDTSKIRIISAHKQVKIFKSDLQARADSAFFSYGDSTMRIYQKPMVWAQGSQLSADTMYIQMKNKKIDNMDLIKNSFVVNTEKDSINFNQVAGKTMKGFFKNEKLDLIFVNGNAESIYFENDSTGNGGMMRSIASRMRVNFTNDSVSLVTFIRKPEHNYYPTDKITEELKTLPNFNWKPKDRPKSKEEIIPTLRKPISKSAPKKEVKPTGKSQAIKPKTLIKKVIPEKN